MCATRRSASLLKEPLLHFLLIGASLFLVYAWQNGRGGGPAQPGAPTLKIVVSRAAIEQMDSVFAKTWQRPPTAEERQGLVDEFVRNEIYYREALAAGLDRDDEVFKRRLRQQMEFVFEDISSWGEPADADLRSFLEKNREKYSVDPQISFRQVFLNPDRRGVSAILDARVALEQLAKGADPGTAGDPTMLEAEFTRIPLGDIKRQFGDEFAKAVLGVTPGSWSGPLRSGFGLHLVLVTQRVEGRLPEVGEIRGTLRRDWTAAKQKEIKDAAYARMRQRYTVTVEAPAATTAPSEAVASRDRGPG